MADALRRSVPAEENRTMVQMRTSIHAQKRLDSGQRRVGKTEWGNIVAACDPCNQKKEARTPQEAQMHLRKPPLAPKVLPVVNESNDPALSHVMPDQWRAYLD